MEVVRALLYCIDAIAITCCMITMQHMSWYVSCGVRCSQVTCCSWFPLNLSHQ